MEKILIVPIFLGGVIFFRKMILTHEYPGFKEKKPLSTEAF